MMPCFGVNGWHPFARKMIDEFSDQEGFLNEVGANLASYSMVGTSEGYYNQIISMMKDLKDHPSVEVRKWAKRGISSYKKQIQIEKLQDESRD